MINTEVAVWWMEIKELNTQQLKLPQLVIKKKITCFSKDSQCTKIETQKWTNEIKDILYNWNSYIGNDWCRLMK